MYNSRVLGKNLPSSVQQIIPLPLLLYTKNKNPKWITWGASKKSTDNNLLSPH